MALPFSRRRGSAAIEVGLAPEECALLVRLLDDVRGLLDDGAGPVTTPPDPLEALVGLDANEFAALADPDRPVDPPEDPAVARLLPDGTQDDPDAAADFRRFTEPGLRLRKRTTLELASEALGRTERPLTLDDEEAAALLKGLTDVRLVLAERLGVRTDEDAAELHDAVREAEDADDPWVVRATLYDVLTWWQEALVEAMGDAPA